MQVFVYSMKQDLLYVSSILSFLEILLQKKIVQAQRRKKNKNYLSVFCFDRLFLSCASLHIHFILKPLYQALVVGSYINSR